MKTYTYEQILEVMIKLKDLTQQIYDADQISLDLRNSLISKAAECAEILAPEITPDTQ